MFKKAAKVGSVEWRMTTHEDTNQKLNFKALFRFTNSPARHSVGIRNMDETINPKQRYQLLF